MSPGTFGFPCQDCAAPKAAAKGKAGPLAKAGGLIAAPKAKGKAKAQSANVSQSQHGGFRGFPYHKQTPFGFLFKPWGATLRPIF